MLGGEARDLSAIALDMERVPPFHRRVYAVARTIPPGATLSYGEIAARLGDRGAARDVGEAMGQNPFPVIVPCHRVVAAGGRVGGFSATGGVTTKLRLLEIEGAQVGERRRCSKASHWLRGRDAASKLHGDLGQSKRAERTASTRDSKGDVPLHRKARFPAQMQEDEALLTYGTGPSHVVAGRDPAI